MPREVWSLRKTLLVAAITIGTMKLGFFLFDPWPLFYYGDSENYLHAALTDLADTDRPYFYGLLVRIFGVWAGSLTVLVASHVVASAIAAWLAVFCLIHFFNVRSRIALGIGIAFALDPLQLLQERLILPETFTFLVLSCFVAAGLRYVTRPAVTTLALSSLLGIILVALRTVYVPLVVGSAVLLPVFALIRDERPKVRRLTVHVALALTLTFCLHSAHRWNLSELSGYTGTYQQKDGFYIAAAWSPVIEEVDGTDPRVADVVKKLPTAGTDSRRHLWNRPSQLYSQDGLAEQLIHAYEGDERAANLAARELALNSFKRDPFGVAATGMKTFLGFFGVGLGEGWNVGRQLLEDQGEYRTLTLPMRTVVQERFGLDAGPAYQRRTTTIKSYHLKAFPWYACLALSPLVLLGALLLCSRPLCPLVAFVLSVNVLLIAATCFGAALSAIRFLHPLGFACVLGLGILIDRAARRAELRSAPGLDRLETQ